MASARILLAPYTQAAASRHGLETAFRLAKGEKGARVYAVYVVEVDRTLPLDVNLSQESERAERCVGEAEELARRYKVKCEGDILQAREAGPAIVDEAVERGAQTIVLGVPQRGRDDQPLDLGKTAEYVLRHAVCEVIVVRQGAAS